MALGESMMWGAGDFSPSPSLREAGPLAASAPYSSPPLKQYICFVEAGIGFGFNEACSSAEVSDAAGSSFLTPSPRLRWRLVMKLLVIFFAGGLPNLRITCAIPSTGSSALG